MDGEGDLDEFVERRRGSPPRAEGARVFDAGSAFPARRFFKNAAQPEQSTFQAMSKRPKRAAMRRVLITNSSPRSSWLTAKASEIDARKRGPAQFQPQSQVHRRQLDRPPAAGVPRAPSIQPLRLLRDRERHQRMNMIGARAKCGNRPSFFLQILRSSGIRRTEMRRQEPTGADRIPH